MDVPRSFAWRPTTTVILLGGFAIILLAMVVSFIASNFRQTVPLTLGSGSYSLWLADDQVERENGLSGVEDLGVNGGMLFDFKEEQHWGIWMKDMKIPLDIIWLDRGKKVVFIKQNVSPDLGTSEVMHPKVPARYVIELQAGSVKQAGIKVGDIARFSVGDE